MQTKADQNAVTGLGENPYELTVQKSRNLFSLWRSQLTLPEFKILDTYLARINSRDPSKRTVTLEKGEIEQLFGVKKINISDLKSRLHNLMSPLDIEDESKKGGFTTISLFEKAIAEPNDDGKWKINLTCTQSALEYVFNIEQKGYLRYKLRCITRIGSRYSYIMFVYLESMRFRKELSWDVDLGKLKRILKCEQEEYCRTYKRFNDRLLKRVQKELNEKTECHFSYEAVKNGRNVVALHIRLKPLQKEIEEELDTERKIIESYEESEVHELWEEALYDDRGHSEFTREELAEIRSVLCTLPAYVLPMKNEGIDIRRYHYIDQKFKTLNNQKNVKHRFKYLLKMMKEDSKAS